VSILWLIKLGIEAYPRPAFSITLLTDRGAIQIFEDLRVLALNNTAFSKTSFSFTLWPFKEH